jgi:hypothetical protein
MSKAYIGQTNRFPDGKISEGNKGQLAISVKVITKEENKHLTLIDFGKDVSWIGLDLNSLNAMYGAIKGARDKMIELCKNDGMN